ncbi:unnamed protein product [Heligmosomoides polygyrus]|uniref:Serpentine receptor class gamma n=1 Tax=Heligmosomoides polygyrus TaxID=6339 RepID=A0A3P7XGR9_HELPZ|nr:unnamed protein product [Heligmosomoides polygyrus]
MTHGLSPSPYLANGIFDILGVIALEWTRADYKIGFGPPFEPMIRLTMSMTGINFFTHIFGCFLMTLNRYTAVCHAKRQQDIWTMRNVFALLIAEIAAAILMHIPVFSVGFVYEPLQDGGWVLVGRNGTINGTRAVAAVITLSYEVISMVLIAMTIYVMNAQLVQRGSFKMTQEMSLVFVAAINCILNILECIYDTSFLLEIDNDVINWLADQVL